MKLASLCTLVVASLAAPWVASSARAAGPLDELRDRAGVARLGRALVPAPRSIVFADTVTSVLCFEGQITTETSPGCFTTPQEPGNCASHSSHYFIQYLFPDVHSRHLVLALGFVSNDAATVFPSAGVIPISYKKPASGLRYPTAQELGSLQGRGLHSQEDLGIVAVDLRRFNLQFADSVALVAAVQFPEGGVFQSIGVGPAIGVEDQLPDQPCDFLTQDTGRHWYVPDTTEHLDWGFEVKILDLRTGLEAVKWSQFKALYRSP